MQRAIPRIAVIVVLLLAGILLVLLVQNVRSPMLATSLPDQQQINPPLIATLPTRIGTISVSSAETRFSFDTINGMAVNGQQQTPIAVPKGSMLHVQGWAVDLPNQKPAGGVILSIDNAVDIAAVYGGDRPDVAKDLRNEAYMKSGFDANIPTDQLTVGRHLIVIKILANDKKTYYQPQQAISIEITG